jgi:anti-sigma factor RsiW
MAGMSKCTHFLKLISRYIDNDLDPLERHAIACHLAVCPECTQVYVSYAAMKKLVKNSYTGLVPDAIGVRLEKPLSVKRNSFSSWNSGIRLAALFVLGISLCAGIIVFSLARRNVAAPMVIGSESGAVMNSPLGALVYYEELSGTTVHTQYLQHLKENAGTPFGDISVATRRASGYKSPLFCDSLTYTSE